MTFLFCFCFQALQTLQLRSRREIDFRTRNVVEVIRKNIQGNIGHDLVDLAVAVSGMTNLLQIGVADTTPLFNQLACKHQRGVDLFIGSNRMSSLLNFGRVQADHFADSAMGSDAIITIVRLTNGE